MGFHEAKGAAVSSVFSTLGRSAVFTPLTGAAVSCTVIKKLEGGYLPSGYEAQVSDAVITIKYRLSEIDRDVRRGEIFTVNGQVFKVVAMADERTDYWRKAIVKN